MVAVSHGTSDQRGRPKVQHPERHQITLPPQLSLSAKSAPVISVVPQGSVLGPILFLLFINIGSNTRLFADDCVVYRTIRDDVDQEALQEDLVRLAEWVYKWGIEFHPQKCSTLSVTRSRSPLRYPYQLKGHTLELQDTTKYLGVDL